MPVIRAEEQVPEYGAAVHHRHCLVEVGVLGAINPDLGHETSQLDVIAVPRAPKASSYQAAARAWRSSALSLLPTPRPRPPWAGEGGFKGHPWRPLGVSQPAKMASKN